MWVERTPEEVIQGQKATEKQARADGLFIGVAAWIVLVLILSSGWIVSFQTGMVAPTRYGGTFWTRLPIFAVAGLPVIFIARHRESRKALRKAESRSICPKCDTPGENNAGASCGCGGTFVPSSTMKWVES